MSRFKTGHTFQFGEQVTPQKLNNAVDEAEFGSEAVDGSSIDVNIGKRLEVAAGGITNDKLADSSVSSAKVQGLAITTDKLADESVTTPKLGQSSVTTPKIEDGAVATAKIQDNAVTTPKIADDAVTTDKVADGAITTGNLQAGSVTTAKIQNDAVTTDKVADGAITRDKLAANAMGIKSIQRGNQAANSTSINITINSVDPAKCIVLLHGGAEKRAGTGEGDSVQYNPWIGSLTATNLNVRFQKVGVRGSFSWEVAEFY